MTAVIDVDQHVHSGLISLVNPVLQEMNPGPTQRALLDAFNEEADAVATIEQCFNILTARRPNAHALKVFFQSWSQTNNSAASVAGLTSRITLRASQIPSSDTKLGYFGVVCSLQRITDEDLGALGGVLHHDLYYRMATTICGDDSWQSKEYCVSAARRFRDWRDQTRLRQQDMLLGLLHTLVHEVYTHGEVELIHDMFQKWLPTHMGISAGDARKVLAWITVHTGGTEANHFKHATDAVDRYCSASNTTVDIVAAKQLFAEYLRRKAAVMEEVSTQLQLH
jgi:hypothetical protein